MALIEVKDIRKVYRVGTERIVALNRINVSIEQGEICCIFGTSGSGKSTLLNVLAGLEKPTKGSVIINGVDIAKMTEKKLAIFRQKNIGFVFQSYNLMATLNGIENVAMPLEFRGIGKAKREKMAKEMLKLVQLGKRMKHTPNQMSGGQQQRVGIARAFVSKPKIVFADEPTGNLDTKTTKQVMEIMIHLARKYNETLIIVSHDPDVAQYADRIINLIDGDIINDEKNVSVIQNDAEPSTINDEEETETTETETTETTETETTETTTKGEQSNEENT